jgi:hypothetical protein
MSLMYVPALREEIASSARICQHATFNPVGSKSTIVALSAFDSIQCLETNKCLFRCNYWMRAFQPFRSLDLRAQVRRVNNATKVLSETRKNEVGYGRPPWVVPRVRY